MSFWESLKPAKRTPQVTGAELSADQKTLALTWSDGEHHPVTARVLRQYCPCAECVEEWSGKRTYDPEVISADMKIIEIAPVGNYALSFTFGDLHRTGIFNWDYLRALATAGRGT
ncbi:MAG: DUF971 domain-containing protein [Myxococcaceae bacterium]|nr:DUF971 domain-containing protein [Myxococcaceae bacterium]